MQWDQLKIRQYYVVVDALNIGQLSGIPFRILAKSLPFLLVEWQDDGMRSAIDYRCMSLALVDKLYLAEFQAMGAAKPAPEPANRCVNCGTLMVQTFCKGGWRFLCPECGSLGGPVDVEA